MPPSAWKKHREGATHHLILAELEPRPHVINPTTDRGHFFFHDTATTEIYPLSLHDALPICYFTPGGAYWEEDNWHQWPPGTVNPPAEPRCYSNVGFGVLGYLVELLGQRPFSAFCKERIFRPLGMYHTGWFLREIDVARHATPYVRASEQMPAREAGLFRAASGMGVRSLSHGTLIPLCLYSFANYPDGALRTSANELGQFVAAYLAQGRGH